MIYYALGDALITRDELLTPPVYKKVTEFGASQLENIKTDPVDLSTGEMTTENFAKTFLQLDDKKPVEFQPIGLGLPLTIMIREVYTGKYPKGNIFGGKKDMLVTSAIKSIVSFEAKPKAINFLMDKVKTGSRIERPSPSSQGTPIMFYSPALLERSLTLELNIVFDNFPRESFEQIGNFFTAASGVPIFLAHGTYLIGAGTLLKLLGSAGETLFDESPVFTSTDAIDIFLPGKPPIPPGYALITSDNIDQIDPSFRDQYRVNHKGEVVDTTGNRYKGEVPYIVISLDGTRGDEFNSFTPTAAGAAILSRFFGIKNRQEQSLDVLLNALKLYNDFSYRQQIDLLDKRIANSTDLEEIDVLTKKRMTLLKNITEDLLKPKF